tara:strand:+ start:192 stop:431 length:240 start_codon:yes stop_codon:yes gene_type:complete
MVSGMNSMSGIKPQQIVISVGHLFRMLRDVWITTILLKGIMSGKCCVIVVINFTTNSKLKFDLNIIVYIIYIDNNGVDD